MITRREALKGILATFTAPAVFAGGIEKGIIMPVAEILTPEPGLYVGDNMIRSVDLSSNLESWNIYRKNNIEQGYNNGLKVSTYFYTKGNPEISGDITIRGYQDAECGKPIPAEIIAQLPNYVRTEIGWAGESMCTRISIEYGEIARTKIDFMMG